MAPAIVYLLVLVLVFMSHRTLNVPLPTTSVALDCVSMCCVLLLLLLLLASTQCRGYCIVMCASWSSSSPPLCISLSSSLFRPSLPALTSLLCMCAYVCMCAHSSRLVIIVMCGETALCVCDVALAPMRKFKREIKRALHSKAGTIALSVGLGALTGGSVAAAMGTNIGQGAMSGALSSGAMSAQRREPAVSVGYHSAYASTPPTTTTTTTTTTTPPTTPSPTPPKPTYNIPRVVIDWYPLVVAFTQSLTFVKPSERKAMSQVMASSRGTENGGTSSSGGGHTSSSSGHTSSGDITAAESKQEQVMDELANRLIQYPNFAHVPPEHVSIANTFKSATLCQSASVSSQATTIDIGGGLMLSTEPLLDVYDRQYMALSEMEQAFVYYFWKDVAPLLSSCVHTLRGPLVRSALQQVAQGKRESAIAQCSSSSTSGSSSVTAIPPHPLHPVLIFGIVRLPERSAACIFTLLTT